MKAALRILGVLVLLLGRGHAVAATPPVPRPLDSSTWMPDVAARVADLRERTLRAEREAATQAAVDQSGGQWWRTVVAALPPEHGR